MSSVFHTWLFLQDGSSEGLSLSSIGSNNLNNPIEKIINYKSFLKLIPNPAQESKLKMVAEWEASGEYYQLYGWLSGPSSKINSHNFDLDDYPDQDFYGDLILFKVDLNTHKCMQITEVDVQTIDIAKRKDEIEEEQCEEDNENNDEDYDSDDKEKGKDDDDEDDDDDEEENENFDYEDDKADGADGDDGLDAEEDVEDYYDDDDYTDVKKKSSTNKTVVCNFTHLVCEGILTEKEINDNFNTLNNKQTKVIAIFEKLLSKLKPKQSILQDLERGIYNWTIREANKIGFTCLWEDRQFNKIYARKGISIYQNLSDNVNLQKFIMTEDGNAYKISFMTPNELCPEKYNDILLKLKEKEKVMFEKRATAGSKHVRCNKCGENDVSVTALQTRASDEGISVFYHCNNCGKQWKRC